MITIRRWTGREAAALRQAKRLSIRAFAAHLGVTVATVSNWESRGELAKLRTETQQLLDLDLTSASTEVRQRFAAILGLRDEPATAVVSAFLGEGRVTIITPIKESTIGGPIPRTDRTSTRPTRRTPTLPTLAGCAGRTGWGAS